MAIVCKHGTDEKLKHVVQNLLQQIVLIDFLHSELKTRGQLPLDLPCLGLPLTSLVRTAIRCVS